MAYHPILYRLLGIPDTGAEPTAYRLLGISPQQATPELVEARLLACKKRLRQNIPGPQFIPMVSLWESELARAAETLLNPRKRDAYHAGLARQARKERQRGSPVPQQDQAAAIRQAVDSAVNPDWTLDEDRRPVVVDRLRSLKVPEPRIRSALAEIPKPVSPAAGPAPGALPFFNRAIDLSLGQGILTSSDENNLLVLAQKLQMTPDEAATAIEGRLAATGAKRVQLQPRGPRVVAAPSAPLPPGIAPHMAPAQVPRAAPQAGLRELDAPAALIDDEQVVNSILAESRGRRRRDANLLWLILIPIAAALLFLLLALACVYLWPRGEGLPPDAGARPPEEKAGPEPGAAATPGAPAACADGSPAACADGSRRPPLCDALLRAATPTDLATAIASAAQADLATALDGAAGLLSGAPAACADGSPAANEITAAETLFRNLLALDSLSAAQQDAVIQALLGAARRPKTPTAGYRALRLLWSALWLAAPPTLSSAAEQTRLVDQCERAWKESLGRSPDDPLHDAARLAQGIADGGDLRMLAAHATDKAIGPVIDKLLDVAADTNRPESSRVLQQFQYIAIGYDRPYGAPTAAAAQRAQLALCACLRRTDNPALAARLRAVLLRPLKLDPTDPDLDVDLTVPADRQRLADRLAAVVCPGGKPAATPAAVGTPSATAPSPAGVAKPSVHRPRSGPSASEVKASFTVKGEPEAVLADVALTMLACRDRAARLAGNHKGECTTEVARLIGPSNRTGSLAAKVSLAPLPAATPASAPAAPAAMAAPPDVPALKKDLLSPSAATRYRAVEQLRDLNTPEAANALLDALERSARARTPADQRTSFRILDAVKTMRQRRVPEVLVDVLPACPSGLVAFQVARALEQGSGTSGGTLGSLPLNHSPGLRKSCADFWKSRLPRFADRWPAGGGAAGAGPAAHAPPAALPAWQPDPTPLKLLALAGACAAEAAEDLKSYSWGSAGGTGGVGAAGARGGTVAARLDLAGDLLQALHAYVEQLERLIREHPSGKTYAVRADLVAQQRQARILASDTPLQKAAVDLDTAAALLEILIDASDTSDAAKAPLERLRAEHTSALAAAPNVLHEMRAAAYQNLALWDLLLFRSSP
jgi:hypothetical protein